MGAWDAPRTPDRTDAPAHPVVLRSGFYIQETEVTNGQFEDFLKQDRRLPARRLGAGLRPTQAGRRGPPRPAQHPAVNISRKLAGRLRPVHRRPAPDRGPVGIRRPVPGPEAAVRLGERPVPDRELANIDSPGQADHRAGRRRTRRDVTEQGLLDMTGNVKEMCRDVWKPYAKHERRRSTTPARTPPTPTSPNTSIRGGDFNSLPDDCTTTQRDDKRAEGDFAENLGFRLVIECPDARPAGRPR